MQAVIIADRSFARRERQMLSRLEVGLADEGVRVIHAIPRALREDPTGQGAGIASSVVGYEDRGTPFTRSRRAAELLRSIQGSDASTRIDIVHAFGLDCWPIARQLARHAHARLLLELWCPQLVELAAAWAADAGPGLAAPPEFVISEPSLGAALRARTRDAKAHLAPWGVHTPPIPRPPYPARSGRPLAVAVLCDAGRPRAVLPAIRGLLDATTGGPETFIFACVDPGPRRHESTLWSAARRLGLLGQFSINPNVEARREPVLEMDLLLLPEALGLQRTLTLEAMGVGMPIVAAADVHQSSLGDGRTARLVQYPTPHAWAEAIRPLISDSSAAQALIQSAHAWVRMNRPAAGHISGVLGAYRSTAGTLAAA